MINSSIIIYVAQLDHAANEEGPCTCILSTKLSASKQDTMYRTCTGREYMYRTVHVHDYYKVEGLESTKEQLGLEPSTFCSLTTKPHDSVAEK